ncbi:Uncharacterised protein [Burkholderia pseudomallei]|nr:Uncharacterised protein [Burkholderia pseudomallei]CAJ4136975.1 Uncharacterised protein [Burkholderia pseudomallei]CAJ4579782.1 Uncharacterised protein [Burkholderia pseudomallei]CAJ4770587.1 Uncharacterised protein [Burkholderia pseudomallei]CAJ4777538.1 Uncharacterised protein [Burkholderia pseudomallei]
MRARRVAQRLRVGARGGDQPLALGGGLRERVLQRVVARGGERRALGARPFALGVGGIALA